MVDFTVAICTYNGETRIADVLEKLRECIKYTKIQQQKISWEIIIIDNNSNDNTAKIIKKYQSKWDKNHPIKYYFEPRQGLAFARKCAIKKAQSELIGFLDDDNLPFPNWVTAAYTFGKSHPQVGAYGGQSHGIFEVTPPPNFERVASFFALKKAKEAFCYNEKYPSVYQRVYPVGAGIVIRKQAWLESVLESVTLPQTGEDVEMLSHIRKNGWQIWFVPEMEIEHKIYKYRLEKDYLIKFFQSIGLTRYQTRILNFSQWQKPLVIPFYLINDFKKIIVHLLKYSLVLQTDIIAVCELKFLLASFYSPIYNCWQYLRNFRKNILKLVLSILGNNKIIFAESVRKVHRTEF
ncbi:hormogonium polysaccharide biosynthesis glycosyltransferase HpsE [Dapis sp. BLCC M126]|uniref:hormogonium polysaccharide biosynthesis glycosyltransferase HpsE n=1 Tax=Dapis sp. BLCC M126 TaxID=3400189 RepID=UPI003CF555CA